MTRRILVFFLAVFTTVSLFAQDATDLERRLRELEQRVSNMQDAAELKRQIEALAAEVEALKTRQTEKSFVAGTQQYGLGAAASKVYRAEPGVSIGGYGEMIYQNFDAPGEISRADMQRLVVYTGYKFSDRVIFNSELEVEHSNVEQGGNVEVEFAYLDFMSRPELNYRAGMVLMPIGLTNEQHEPTAFLGARRPVVEQHIIPSTWMELGGGVFGDVGPVSYRAYLVTGLNSEHFGAEEGLREGRQQGAEAAADDWGIVARADYHPFEGTFFGASLYRGDSGQGAGYGGRVSLGEVHADAKMRGLSLRALYARGSVGDVVAINAANGLTGDESVGKSLGGWYVEGGYDLSDKILPRGDMSLTPYVRYESLDTQRSVPRGFARNPENERSIFTIGFAFKPISQTVIKVDWQNVDNEAGTGINQWNVALGYIF